MHNDGANTSYPSFDSSEAGRRRSNRMLEEQGQAEDTEFSGGSRDDLDSTWTADNAGVLNSIAGSEEEDELLLMGGCLVVLFLLGLIY